MYACICQPFFPIRLQIGMQPIHLAAAGGKSRIVDMLIDDYHVDPQAQVMILL